MPLQLQIIINCIRSGYYNLDRSTDVIIKELLIVIKYLLEKVEKEK